ncbi:MAG: hypothetical protein ABSE68_01355 [Minisyncoccia bacterium]
MEQFPTEPNPENVEAGIERLLDVLHGYAELFDENPDIQEEWYDVEMEAEVAKDRETAKAHLEEFIRKLEEKKEEREESQKSGDINNQEISLENKEKKERILSREEILSQLGSRCEILKIERELADAEGIYLLEIINKENTKRYVYQRKGSFMGSSGKIESSGTTIRSEDLDDDFSKTIADYDSETNEWMDQ